MENEEKKKKFIEYAQQHPEYYPVMQSGIFIKILELLAKEAKHKNDLVLLMPAVDKEDMELIIETLLKMKLVSKIISTDNILFYTNENGKEFLLYYDLAKENFSVA